MFNSEPKRTTSPDVAMVVEDETLLREPLAQLLRTEFAFKTVFEATDGKEAVKIAEKHAPSLVLMDLLLPKQDGLKTTDQLTKRFSDIKVLIVSNELDEVTLERALRSSAMGFVDKRASGTQVLSFAIRQILKGELYYSDTVSVLRKRFRQSPEAFTKILSKREERVLELLCQGLDDTCISREMGVALKTARTHRDRILAKLHLHTSPELINYGITHGFWKYKEAVHGNLDE